MRLLPFIFFALLISSGCSSNSVGADGPKQISKYPSVELSFKPNIVWIVTEDLGPYLPSWGDSTIETPHISRLVREGVKYTHVFSPSGVCAPSRAAISTGMYPTHIGANNMRTGGNPKFFPKDIVPYEAVLPVGVRMHSEELRRSGYYCTNNSKEDYQYKKAVTAWDESSRTAHWKNRTPGQPFFAIFNITTTHESQIWVRAKDSLWIPENAEVPVPPYLPDTEVGKQDVRRMYSNVKVMDAQVGEFLRELEEANLMDSTIIFWYPDHGGPLPRQKRLCYDSGLRVPMVVRFPRAMYAGTEDNRLISFIDFAPTLMSLIGMEPPSMLDGRAFLGPNAGEDRTYIHAAGDRFDGKRDMIRAVRNKRFKYLKNFQPEKPYYLPVAYREQMPIMQELLRLKEEGGLNEYQAQWFRPTKDPEELFDCEKDPHELHNLAQDPEYQDILVELRQECERWMEEIDDKGLMPEAELVNQLWPGMVQPETKIPIFSLEGGKARLKTETPGASLGYQILEAGEETGQTWEVYVDPVIIPDGKVLHAIAHRVGYKPSEVVVVK